MSRPDAPEIDALVDALARAPTLTLDQTTVLFRVHRAVHDPMHFSSDGTGRFDPPPHARGEFGTCYFGADALTAFIEVFGRTNPVAEHLIDARVLTEIWPTTALRVADLTERTTLSRIGIYPEVSVGSGYTDSQRWADALYANGFAGVHYSARHDPAFRCLSIALFSPTADRLRAGKTTPMPAELIEPAEQEFGLIVIPSGPID